MARERTPYIVTAAGYLLAKFSHEQDAQRAARIWSEGGGHTEVHFRDRKAGGIVGQYQNGHLTPEFAHLADLDAA